MFFKFSPLILLSSITVAQIQYAKIAGIVADSVSHVPLVGTNILIVGTTIGTTTDTEGRFIVEGLQPTQYHLEFRYVGYAETDVTVDLTNTDSVWLHIKLSPEHIESEMVVVTATRTLRSISDVPVRVEAIPEEEIEEKLLMTPSSVAMLLNESTGMRVQTTSAASSTANLRIQGLRGRYTQVLHDGVPTLGGLSAGLGLTQLIPLDLRQVEVLKGATSSLYGTDAIAGVVNFLPKVPGERPELTLLLNGTTQKGIDAAGFLSQRIGSTGISFLASHNRQARYDVDNDGFADVAEFRRWTLTPRLLGNFSDNLSLRLSLNLLSEQRVGGSMDVASPATGAPPYIERLNTSRNDISTHIDWRATENQSLSLKLAYLRLNRSATYGVQQFEGIQNVYFSDAQYSLHLPRHQLLAGFAYRLEEFEDRILTSRSYQFIVPSLFAQDEILFSDGISLLLGGRLDAHNEFGTFFVPRASLMIRPGQHMTLRLGAGTGYKAPTIFVEEAEETGFKNVRPLLNAKPERARSASIDLNWRGVFDATTFDVNAALFLTRIEDALLAHEDSLQAEIVFLRNATGPVKSTGTELSARLTYHDLKILLGYTYLSATQEDQGITNTIELNPKHSTGIVIVWENHEHQLKVGLENYWTGKQRVSRNPYRTETPAYWITGMIVEKGFGRFKVFVNFENMFDSRQTRYEPVFVRNSISGEIRTLPIYAPLEGRVINGGVRLMLGD
ncbi:MAG TPA: TonB-dependent receptor [Bacteroidota bacterium]|nr:TonB-dependent receptor [Bacteroidota bacterium]